MLHLFAAEMNTLVTAAGRAREVARRAFVRRQGAMRRLSQPGPLREFCTLRSVSKPNIREQVLLEVLSTANKFR